MLSRSVIYVREDGNSCSIRSLWRESTNCVLLIFTPFLVIDSSLSICYRLLSFYPLSISCSLPFYFLLSMSYQSHTSHFSCSCRSPPLFFLSSFHYYSPLHSLYWPVFLVSHGADPQPVCVSVCAPVHGQISLSSELQPGSLPPDADADESSSDMLVIVDDPVSSAPQSRATNSPSSVSGSVSDNMNGERENTFQLTLDLDV